jgi:acetylornithine deacetylase/succinyl-diaminopimelate desuccinylase-like protein
VTSATTPRAAPLLDDLRRLCALPSGPEAGEARAAAAGCVAELLRARSMQVELLPTPGAPVVIGRRAGRSPATLLLYHHYDTAPAGAWRAWHHEPYELAERDDQLFARGVAEGKGPLCAHLAALEALLAAEGELPCGIVVLAEGEALAGSPNLGAVVAERLPLLRADACLATGGERGANGIPLCYGGAKGLLSLALTAVGANQPLAAGLAASAPNPLWRLVWTLGQIKSDQEEILIDGFYDDVEGPSREDNQRLRDVTLDETGRLAAWGLDDFLFGMRGAALNRAESTLPTCNVSGLTVQPAGAFAAIPVVATARLDFQLVPRQRPQAILERLRNHLCSRGIEGVTAERLPGGYPAASTPFDTPFAQQVRQAVEQTFGAPPHWLPLAPTALPLFFLREALGLPAVVVGCARAASATSGPNEHIPLADLLRHGELLIALMHALGDGR